MPYFPMCINLADKTVILVGNGEQIKEKIEKLRPFKPQMVIKNDFTVEDAEECPALVVVGDVDLSRAEKIADLCRSRAIPVNVVDVPRLCSFIFPAMISAGDLAVSVSTGGKSPGAAVYVRDSIKSLLPEHTGEILDWLAEIRPSVKERCSAENYKRALRAITEEAFSNDRILTDNECISIIENT